MMGGGDDNTTNNNTTTTTNNNNTNTNTNNTLPSGRYVQLIHTIAYDSTASGNDDDKNAIINVAELEVFDSNGINLANGKLVEGANFHGAGPLSNLTDGNKSNFAHTLGRDQTEYDSMKVDLGSVKEIKKIVITNRVDCCGDRTKGVKVVILGTDGSTVIKETPPITATNDTYTVTFPENEWT
jgi:hypothetical protein